MNDKSQFLRLLESLESKIGKVKEDLRTNSLTVEQVVKQLKEPLGKFVRELFPNQELEEKQRVYGHIARFLQEQSNNELATCLAATYLLCKETEPLLLDNDFPSPQAQNLAEEAKKNILAIRVHYELLKSSELYNCKTEIFFTSPNNDKPTVKRIEEELPWDRLPQNVRETFIKESTNQLGFTLYP